MFNVFGGKYKLRKGVEQKINEIRDLFENDYLKELVDIKIVRLYIDDVKRKRGRLQGHKNVWYIAKSMRLRS